MNDIDKWDLLEKELMVYFDLMSKASDIIYDQGVSKYPIFIAHQQTLDVGIVIAKIGEVKGNWNIQASTLEELVTKQLLHEDKVEEFVKIFKSPVKQICILTLSELGARFVFLKR